MTANYPDTPEENPKTDDWSIEEMVDYFRKKDICSESDEEKEKEDEYNEEEKPRLDAENLCIYLHLDGLRREAFDIAKQGLANSHYWQMFRVTCQDFFPEFLEIAPRLFEGCSRDNSYSHYYSCLKEVLAHLPEQEKREWLEKIAVNKGMPENLRTFAIKLAYESGMHQSLLENLAKMVKDNPLSDNQLSQVVTLSIEKAMLKNPDAAEKIWEDFVAFLHMCGLKFLSEFEGAFDFRISEHIQQREWSIDEFQQFSQNVPADFKQTKESIDREMAKYIRQNQISRDKLIVVLKNLPPELWHSKKAGAISLLEYGEKESVIKPMLQWRTERELAEFAGELYKVTIPEWVKEAMYCRLMEFIEKAEIEEYSCFYLCRLAIAEFWSSKQQKHFLQMLMKKLQGCEKEKLQEWMIALLVFVQAVNAKQYKQLEHQINENHLINTVFRTAELNLPFVWQIIEHFSKKVQEEFVIPFLEVGIKTNIQWALTIFSKKINRENARNIARTLFYHTTAKQWPILEKMMEKAIDLSKGKIQFSDKSSLIELFKGAPFIAKRILSEFEGAWLHFFYKDDYPWSKQDNEVIEGEWFLASAEKGLKHWKREILNMKKNPVRMLCPDCQDYWDI